tara:strand:+ start:115687 stop:116202 length:516 start_codon:yes stop_codon:yes gene_type:complete
MFSSKLKHHFIKKKIDKLSKALSVQVNDTNQKIQSVAIITQNDFSLEYDFQEILIERLQLRNPRIYSYRKFNKDDEKSYKHFSEIDFDWKGEVVEPSLQSFLDEPFDLLICFFSKKNIFLEYTALASKATFKLGLSGLHPKLLDIQINTDASNVDVFFEETKKYLQIVKKL